MAQANLVHPAQTISIVIFILVDDCFHGIRQILVLPGTVFVCEIFIEVLATACNRSCIHSEIAKSTVIKDFTKRKIEVIIKIEIFDNFLCLNEEERVEYNYVI